MFSRLEFLNVTLKEPFVDCLVLAPFYLVMLVFTVSILSPVVAAKAIPCAVRFVLANILIVNITYSTVLFPNVVKVSTMQDTGCAPRSGPYTVHFCLCFTHSIHSGCCDSYYGIFLCKDQHCQCQCGTFKATFEVLCFLPSW